MPGHLDSKRLHVPAWEGFACYPFDIVALYTMIREKPIVNMGDYETAWRGGGAIWFQHI